MLARFYSIIILRKVNFIMVCNKCGTQCEENQAFCLNCGNPIQLTADFNLIEKELASNIDELMNEIEANGEGFSEEVDEPKTIKVSSDEISMGLKVVDVNRTEVSSFDIDDFEDIDEEDIEPVLPPTTRKEIVKKSSSTSNTRKTKNSNKKIFAIVGSIVAVIAIVAVTFVFILGGDDSDSNAKNFGDYYASAEAAYNTGNMDKSLEDAYEALRLIKGDADEIKVRKLIHNIYNQQNFTGAIYLQNVEALIKLGDTSEDYYGVIVEKYISEKNTELLMKIMENVGVDKAKEYLGDSFIDVPIANQESGEYINVVALKLTAAKGCKIYYCINDDISKVATEYGEEIIINEVGEHVVSAYAVSEQGVPSFITKYSYKVIEGEAAGPVVTPASGIYTEPTKITIQIPEGGKAYYTYTQEGEKPTQASTEYKEPIDMRMDAEIFMAIVVDKYGNVSDVTKVQYKFKLKRNETLSSGKDKVWAFYTNSGKINEEGILADGSVLTVNYETAAIINNAEYYIYTAVTTLTQEETITTTGITYLGINTYDGTVVEGLIQAGDDFLLPEIKE